MKKNSFDAVTLATMIAGHMSTVDRWEIVDGLCLLLPCLAEAYVELRPPDERLKLGLAAISTRLPVIGRSFVDAGELEEYLMSAEELVTDILADEIERRFERIGGAQEEVTLDVTFYAGDLLKMVAVDKTEAGAELLLVTSIGIAAPIHQLAFEEF